MKIINLLLLSVATFVLLNCESSVPDNAPEGKDSSSEREFYQLRVYTLNSDEQLNVMNKYLKDAYLPGLKRRGIKDIGVFKQRADEKDSTQKIFILIPFKRMDQFLNLENQLNEDEEYLSNGREYLKASYDQAPYQRMESILMRAFSDFPQIRPSQLENPRSERIYELRSYESPTETYYKNKVEMFNAGGEIKLFDRLEFQAVFYGEVISGPKMPNLMYMTTFSDQASRDKHWETFVESPEWKELIAMPKYENNVSKADITFLFPTEYSDY